MSTPSGAGTDVDTKCYNDWIQIPCAIDYQNGGSVISTSTTTGCASRICGGVFTAVQDTAADAPVYSEYCFHFLTEGYLTRGMSLSHFGFQMIPVSTFHYKCVNNL